MKILVFALILYFAYRVFIKPIMLSEASGKNDNIDNRDSKTKIRQESVTDNGDYIDYEEVD